MYGAITLCGGPFQAPSNNSLFGNFTLVLQFEKPEKKQQLYLVLCIKHGCDPLYIVVDTYYLIPGHHITDVHLSFNPFYTTPVGFNI